MILTSPRYEETRGKLLFMKVSTFSMAEGNFVFSPPLFSRGESEERGDVLSLNFFFFQLKNNALKSVFKTRDIFFPRDFPSFKRFATRNSEEAQLRGIQRGEDFIFQTIKQFSGSD